MKSIKKLIYNWRLRKAVRRANDQFNHSGLRMFVHLVKGKLVVKSKQEWKQIIDSGVMKKGVTIQDIEKIALYKTR